MLKKHFLALVFLSLAIHLYFSYQFPFTRDELNIWNLYSGNPTLSGFWQYFTKYETQAPLFYLAWFPAFYEDMHVVFYRLPSLLFYGITLFYWNRLLPFSDKKNSVSWALILFAPFLILYSSFFLPYSLMLMGSVINYYYFFNYRESRNLKNLSLLIVSSLGLCLTHYFGALQVLVLMIYFIFSMKKLETRLWLSAAGIFLISVFLLSTDFLNDISQVHAYQTFPGFLKIAGDFNLLMGGKFVFLLLAVVFLYKRKFEIFKEKEFIFICLVTMIALVKSILISPTFEARYLLILVYPLYSLTSKIEFKYSVPVIVVCCLISLKLLIDSFGSGFVIDFEKIKKDEISTGLITGPCPKYYLYEANYLCKGHLADKTLMLSGVERMYVDEYNLKYFLATVPESKCQPLIKGLYNCSVPQGLKKQ